MRSDAEDEQDCKIGELWSDVEDSSEERSVHYQSRLQSSDGGCQRHIIAGFSTPSSDGTAIGQVVTKRARLLGPICVIARFPPPP